MTFAMFTTCRPFEDEFAIIQTNAIKSWTLLDPRPEILLVGDEAGTANLAQKLDCKHIRSVTRNRWGTPLVSGLFWTALTCAESETLVYCNSDVILMQDFALSVEAAARTFDVFLMAGARWDMKVRKPIRFAQGWDGKMHRSLRKAGKRHAPTGMDYFAFTQKTLDPKGFPPLAIGRTAWDSWLAWRALVGGIPLIDATGAVTAVHQVHEKGGKTVEKKINFAVAAGDRLGRGYIWEARWRVAKHGRKYIVEKAPEPVDRWAEEVGWDWR